MLLSILSEINLGLKKKSQFLLLSALLTVHYHDKHKTFFFIKELVTNPVMPLQQ